MTTSKKKEGLISLIWGSGRSYCCSVAKCSVASYLKPGVFVGGRACASLIPLHLMLFLSNCILPSMPKTRFMVKSL